MFRKISEGDVFATTKENFNTSGPRTVVLPDGKLLCTFMVNSASGSNDFTPMAAYSEDGTNWTEPKPLWPELMGRKCLFVSARPNTEGGVCVAGKGWDVDFPGEHWWSDEESAMKQNKLVFALSEDGYTFPEPTEVALPFVGAAEQPGGMLAEGQKLTMIYSPYPVIGHPGETDLNCMVLLRSEDGGKHFVSSKFAQVEGPSEYAESWITRLSDGRLFVSTWQTATPEKSNQYLLSDDDDGATFAGPFIQPFRGQSTGISAWKDGSVLIAYNQRKEGTVGVWLAMEKFNGAELELLENQPVWAAEVATRSGSSGDFSQWTDFAFGEPHVSVLPDDSLLVTLWYRQSGVSGIRYVRLVRE